MVVESLFISAGCTKSESLFDTRLNFGLVCVVLVLDEIRVAVLAFSMSLLLHDTGINVKVALLCSLETFICFCVAIWFDICCVV